MEHRRGPPRGLTPPPSTQSTSTDLGPDRWKYSESKGWSGEAEGAVEERIVGALVPDRRIGAMPRVDDRVIGQREDHLAEGLGVYRRVAAEVRASHRALEQAVTEEALLAEEERHAPRRVTGGVDGADLLRTERDARRLGEIDVDLRYAQARDAELPAMGG